MSTTPPPTRRQRPTEGHDPHKVRLSLALEIAVGVALEGGLTDSEVRSTVERAIAEEPEYQADRVRVEPDEPVVYDPRPDPTTHPDHWRPV